MTLNSITAEVISRAAINSSLPARVGDTSIGGGAKSAAAWVCSACLGSAAYTYMSEGNGS